MVVLWWTDEQVIEELHSQKVGGNAAGSDPRPGKLFQVPHDVPLGEQRCN